MSNKGKVYLIGNAHLDPIWLWRWQEGCSEVLQTFRSALDRLYEYNDFVFTCSSAAYYRWVEEIDPEMFEEITEMVKKGRWVPVNGWWVQPDCNMPSGESFARQALYSQLYFYEKFGKICRTGYNVDSFGHNAMMPQLLRQGGMNAYVMMRPSREENPDMPENLFWWDSSDGSRVMTYRIPSSYGKTGKIAIDEGIDECEKRTSQTGHAMMLFYGVGNHGGGPTRGDIEHLKIKMNQEGYSSLEFSSPDDFFEEICMQKLDLPTWSDDMQHHASGCYSAVSLVKQLNRKAENLLDSSEKWDTICSKTLGVSPKTSDFAESWRSVCFNQFHDILCGCSIMESYEDVKESMGYAMNIASNAQNNAILRLSRRIDTWVDGVSDPVCSEVRHESTDAKFPRPVVVFNPLSFEINRPVRVRHPSKKVVDSNGNEVAFQNVRASRSNDSHLDTVFLASLPALGYATYWITVSDEEASMEKLPQGKTLEIENEYMKVVFDKETGGISSLVNKEDSFDYVSDEPLAVPTVIDDVKTDTWAHAVFKFQDIKGKMELVSAELVENGNLRSIVRTKHKFNNSILTQDFILSKGQKTLRVKCKAIWSEDFTMLKMPFPLSGSDEISTYEIPCGYIKRPCNGEEEPALQWADLTLTGADGERRGLSVMSDSKYSYDCPGTQLRLTCLRNVIFADHFSKRPPANFDFTDEGLQRFEYGVYLHKGEAESSDIVMQATAFNNRPTVVAESYHKGAGEPQAKSFIKVEADNVIVTALKFCEDNSGDIILRCYETKGKETSTFIYLPMADASFKFDIGKHQIKTFRIDKEGFVKEVTFLEGITK
ncbi:MAG TPA: glycoside hydrolase family 38 C-terminal domain-containing protein [Clostridia bacterium]|nr:glycoside hydrolase family 38 C-terminal domain-containing protein [Clostridia bacterium]